MNRINEELEDKLQNSLDNRYLQYMFTLNKGLIYYVSALNSNEALLKKLQMGRGMQFSENERELLDDVVIENRQSLQQAEIYANILASLMDARASVVNNSMNVLMRTLNIVTIAITLPTFVASIFGMNVKFPFGLGENNPYSFWIIIAIFVLSVAGVLFVWRKRK